MEAVSLLYPSLRNVITPLWSDLLVHWLGWSSSPCTKPKEENLAFMSWGRSTHHKKSLWGGIYSCGHFWRLLCLRLLYGHNDSYSLVYRTHPSPALGLPILIPLQYLAQDWGLEGGLWWPDPKIACPQEPHLTCYTWLCVVSHVGSGCPIWPKENSTAEVGDF